MTNQTPYAPTPRTDLARFLLWPVLLVSVIGNAVASFAGADTAAHLAFGSVTALTATTLVVRRLRERR